MLDRVGRRARPAVIAALVATFAVSSMVSPASAYTAAESGLTGPYSVNDSSVDPFATCTYKDEGIGNWIWLDWFRVKAPTVYAADRNSSKRESRTVTFQLKVEKNTVGSSDPWKVVDTSPIQRKIAYDDQAAALSPIKFFFTPNKTFNNGQKARYRVQMLIKWLKKDGSVEGSVKIWPTYYKENSPYGPQQNTDFCPAVDTDG